MVKTGGEAGVNMTTGLTNLIIVEGVIPAGWEFSSGYHIFNFNLTITCWHFY